MKSHSLQKTSENYSTPIFLFLIRLIPDNIFEAISKSSLLVFNLRTVALFVTFVLVDFFMRRAGYLDLGAYSNELLVVGLLQRLGPLMVIILILMVYILTRYGRLLSPWTIFDSGPHLRYFIVFLACLMAWPLSLYEYNYYFDQAHLFDRILIICLVPLIYYRPIFIFPFLLMAFTVLWQFAQPSISSGAIFAHKLQVLHVLNLFAAVLFLHAITGCRRTDLFLLFSCCLVASAYWVPALTKWQLGWLSHGHLYHMPLAAYAHGWLAFVQPDTIVALAKFISYFDWPMMIFVLFFETACIFFLWQPRFSVSLLVCAIFFHLGVIVLYGYLMWTWILLDMALLLLLLVDRKREKNDIYQANYFITSVILIGFSSYWCNPSSLGWLDTKLSYTYRLEVLGLSGKRYILSPSFFSPYDDTMTMSNFGYLIKDYGLLVSPYGTVRNRQRADEIMSLKTAEQVFALEQKVAKIKFDPQKSERFYSFVLRYVVNRSANPDKLAFLRVLSPPSQFLSFRRDPEYMGQEPAKQLIVSNITTLFDGENLLTIRKHELARLDIEKQALEP